jgi:hypothetical protein
MQGVRSRAAIHVFLAATRATKLCATRSTSIFSPKTWGARPTTVGQRSDLRVEAFVGRGSRIRTCDLKYPKLPRYQAALYPVIWAVWLSCETAADKGAEARGLPN